MEHLISLLAQYGLLLVFANVLLAQAGLPLPAQPTLIVAGALVRDAGDGVAGRGGGVVVG